MEMEIISEEERKNIKETGKEFAYEGLDIDRFKDINDVVKRKLFLEGYKEALEEMKGQEQNIKEDKIRK